MQYAPARLAALALVWLALSASAVAQPNYVISGMRVDPTSVRPGEEIEIECRVENVGTRDVGYETDLTYTFVYRAGGSPRVEVVDDDTVERLDAGEESRWERARVDVPDDADPGPLAITCRSDSSDEVDESNESDNNWIYSANIVAAGPPDLVVENAEADGVWEVGGRADVRAYVANRGDRSTGSTRVGYYLVSAADGREWFLDSDRVAGLSPDERDRVSESVTVPGAPPGRYFVRFRADLEDEEDEGAGEGNNDTLVSDVEVVIPPAELSLDVNVSPSSGDAGRPFTVTCRVTNTGQAGTSGGVPVAVEFRQSGREDAVGVTRLADISPGQSRSAVFEGAVPDWAAAGRADLRCAAVYEGGVAEDVGFTVTTTSAPPAQPVATGPGTPTAPGPVVGTLQPTLRWRPAANASSYVVNVRDEASGGLVVRDAAAGGTSYAVPAGLLAPGRRYKWDVTARNSGGGEGTPSEDLYFRTAEAGGGAVPNLTVTALSVGATAVERGERFAVECTVVNEGPGPAVASRTAVRFRYFDVNDVEREVRDTRPTPALGAGASHDVAGEIEVPAAARAGRAAVACLADADDANPDETTDEDNAGGTEHVVFIDVVVPTDEPDLVVGGVAASENPVTAGQTVTVSGTVENAGGGDAGESAVGFYFFQSDRRERLASQAVPALGTGESRPRSQVLRVPDWATPGEATLRMAADDQGLVDESSETNNEGFALVTVVEPGPADLAVTEVTLDRTSAERGDDVEASCTVRNGGGAATPGAARVRFAFRHGSETVAFGGAPSVSGLSPNRSTTRTAVGRVPYGPAPGSTVDVVCTAESDGDPTPSDNTGRASFTVEGRSGPTGPASPPAAPSPSAPGAAAESAAPTLATLTPTLQWSTSAGAASYGVYVSAHPYGEGSVVFEREGLTSTSVTVPEGRLAPGRRYRWNVSAQNGAGQAFSTTRLHFRTASDSSPGAGVVLSSVSPDPVPGLDGDQDLTLRGSGFTASAAVVLRNLTDGGGPHTEAPVSWSPTELRVRANLTNTSAEWSAVVVQGGAASDPMRFDVAAQGGATAAPTVTSVTPSPVPPRAIKQDVVVRGTGFSPSSRVYFTDVTFETPYPAIAASDTEYLSSTALRVRAGFGTYASEWTVEVETAGRRSTPLSFSVEGSGSGGGQSGPALAITSVSPSTVRGGTASVTLTGSGFGTAPVVSLLRAGESSAQAVGASGTDTRLTFTATFPDEAASYNVTVEAGGRTTSTSLNVVPESSPSGGGEVTVAGLRFTAGAVHSLGGSRKQLSGGVSLEDVLFFSGTVVVDEAALTVSGTGLVYARAAGLDVEFYNGAFEFSVNGQLRRLAASRLEEINMRLRLAGLPVQINGLSIVPGGLRVDGRLSLPAGFESTAEINSLTVTSAGVDVAGAVTVPTVFLTGQLTLGGASLTFDTATDSFRGRGQLRTPLFGVDADVTLVQGALDAVELYVEPGTPIPVASTGLSIKGGGGAVRGIRSGTYEVELRTSLVPTAQGSLDVLELASVTLTMSRSDGVRGAGSFKVFGQPVGSAYLALRKTGGELGGAVNFAGVLDGQASLGISGGAAGLSVQGDVDARLRIPACGGVVCGSLSTLVGLPHDVGSVRATLRNNRVNAGFSVQRKVIKTISIRGGVQLTYSGGGIDVAIGRDYAPAGRKLFAADATFVDPPTGERLDAQTVIVGRDALNAGARVAGGRVEQTFEVAEDFETLILRVRRADGGVPDPELTLPDGSVVTADDQFLGSGLLVNEDEKEAFFVLSAPARGTYTVALNGAGIELTAAVSAGTPTVLMGAANRSGGAVELSWVDDGVGGDLALYYDDDASGADGVLVADGIKIGDDADGLSWTPDASVPTGDYFVYGVADNGGAPTVSYTPNAVRVVAPGAPPPPSGVRAVVTPDGLVARWDPAEGVGHRVYVSDGSSVTFRSPAYDATDPDRAAVSAAQPGRTYTVAVTAVSADGRESDLSDAVLVSYVSATENNAPTAAALPALVVARPGQEVRVDAAGFDPDDDALEYTAVLGPDGLSVSASGSVVWTPGPSDRGEHVVRVRVTDPSGAADSSDVRVRVVDPDSDRGAVSFGSPVYRSADRPAQVVLSDLRLDADVTRPDAAALSVWSTSSPTPRATVVRETQASSGLFVGSVGLGGSSGMGVAPGDTLYVRYAPDGQDAQVSVARFDPGGAVASEPDAPLVYEVSDPYPNPSASHVTVGYSSPRASEIRVDVFDALGRHVVTLADGPVAPGDHTVTWDAVVAPGTYFVRFVSGPGADDAVVTKRVVIVR